MQDLSDYELMLLVKGKNRSALSTLYDRHVTLIYSAAYRTLKEESTARDIVQSVFLRLWTTQSDFNPDKGQFSGWLLTITRNLMIDHIRKKRRYDLNVVPYTNDELDRLSDERTLSPENSVMRDSLVEHIQQKYKHLSNQQIILLKHFYWEGYTLKELSEKYGQPLGTIKNRLHQTLKILRRHLMTEGEEHR